EVEQYSARIGMFHAERAIEIPGVGNPALATTRFVRRQAGFQRGIVETLHFPCDDSVLHVDLPGASAGTIHAMSAAYNFVVLPAIAIELFPSSQLRVRFIANPRKSVFALHCSPRTCARTIVRRTDRNRPRQAS